MKRMNYEEFIQLPIGTMFIQIGGDPSLQNQVKDKTGHKEYDKTAKYDVLDKREAHAHEKQIDAFVDKKIDDLLEGLE